MLLGKISTYGDPLFKRSTLCSACVLSHPLRFRVGFVLDARTDLIGPPKLRLWLIPHDVYENMSMDKPLDLSECVTVAHYFETHNWLTGQPGLFPHSAQIGRIQSQRHFETSNGVLFDPLKYHG